MSSPSKNSPPSTHRKSSYSRRQFLKTSSAGVAAATFISPFTISGTKASGNVIGANDRIRIGVAGINGRGSAHIDSFAGMADVDVTYLIDPDRGLFDARIRQVESKGGNRPTCVQDIRVALEDDNLDAVSVATCNHWHSLITVWSCQAGKDVYVEKPISHNVFEGRKCVEAAEKYGRVVQHGTQNRSSGGKARLMAAVQSGKYGELLVSKGYCCKPRWSIGRREAEMAPEDLDWNLWVGPAPMQDFHRNLHPYNWHWFWETGNGDTGNQGVHEIDIARWAIKDSTHPNRIWSLGGRYIPGDEGDIDQGETPNMQLSIYEYDGVLLLFETRGLVENGGPPRNVSNEFYTTEGVIRGDRFYAHGETEGIRVEGEDAEVTEGGAFGSFINTMRSRAPEDNNCDAEVAHYSSSLCHLANISYRLGEPARFDSRPMALDTNEQVSQGFDMVLENLETVGIQLDEHTYQLGRKLDFDPKTEQFIDDDQANELLTRPYREPFVVPEEV